MEGYRTCIECEDWVNGVLYVSKIKVENLEVVVRDNPPSRPELTEKDKKNMLHEIFVTMVGKIDIPYEYVKTNACPRVRYCEIAKIIEDD